MSNSVDFFFDVGSPASYLAYTQLPGICARTDATLMYRPMLLGGVFQATGNAAPGNVEAKGNHMKHDLARFAKRYQVPLQHNPFFPINTLFLMRIITGVQLRHPERFDALLATVFGRMWVEPANLNDAIVTAGALAEAGFDPEQMQALAADAEVKNALRSTTEEAIARGAYGAPTMYVGQEMYFGQDRLDFVEEDLKHETAAA